MKMLWYKIWVIGLGINIRCRSIWILVLKICANKEFSRYLEGLIMIYMMFNNKAQNEKKFESKRREIRNYLSRKTRWFSVSIFVLFSFPSSFSLFPSFSWASLSLSMTFLSVSLYFSELPSFPLFLISFPIFSFSLSVLASNSESNLTNWQNHFYASSMCWLDASLELSKRWTCWWKYVTPQIWGVQHFQKFRKCPKLGPQGASMSCP